MPEETFDLIEAQMPTVNTLAERELLTQVRSIANPYSIHLWRMGEMIFDIADCFFKASNNP